MKTLFFDAFAGISGDMTLGALVDLGVPFEFLKSELSKLGLDGYELSTRRVSRAAIDCAKVDVRLAGEPDHHHPDHHHHDDHHHGHHHGHHHDDHHHDHHHDDHHRHDHPHNHRGLTDIAEIIHRSSLSERIKSRAIAIFAGLAEAEGKVHGIPAEKVHFHEVGATDAIVDIVGACIGFEFLEIERFVAAPLRVGHGFVTCAHGNYPIPAPGTAELLKGIPFFAGDTPGEFTTPTGAAIVAALCTDFSRSPEISVEKIGYGAGNRDFPTLPNALRLMIGHSESRQTDSGFERDAVTVLEATVDDQTAEELGFAMERWMDAGALDVFFTGIQMKKNRPGTLITLLCRPTDEKIFSECLLRDTTTLGIRVSTSERRLLDRKIVPVETEFGPIRLKIAGNGVFLKFHPEYEDCREAALKNHVPLREIQAAVLRAYEKQQTPDGQ